MNFLHAVILGIIEGFTEFLPISSTGHLILASDIMRLAPTDFLKSFEITIQLGAILSVVVLYFKTLTSDLAVLKRVLMAFLPTAVIGFIFYRIIKGFLLNNNAVVLWALFLGGILLIIFEWRQKENPDASEKMSDISYKQAFFIGLFQSIAAIPGISRSAATIIGGSLLGVKRKTIVEFSFLLAVPTMAAATGFDLLKSAANFSFDHLYFLLIGFVVSFVVAMASIKLLLHFIKNNSFIPFGIYRIVLAFIFWLVIL